MVVCLAVAFVRFCRQRATTKNKKKATRTSCLKKLGRSKTRASKSKEATMSRTRPTRRCGGQKNKGKYDYLFIFFKLKK